MNLCHCAWQSSFESTFFWAHYTLFAKEIFAPRAELDKKLSKWLSDCTISNTGRFKVLGAHVAIVNIATLFGNGAPDPHGLQPCLRRAFQGFQDNSVGNDEIANARLSKLSGRSKFVFAQLDVFLKHAQRASVHPAIHVHLIFICSLISIQGTWGAVKNEPFWKTLVEDIPWARICSFLNFLLHGKKIVALEKIDKFRAKDFPHTNRETVRPLLEDFIIRGLLFTRWLYPQGWFANTGLEDVERMSDLPSLEQARYERMVWLGMRIASVSQ